MSDEAVLADIDRRHTWAITWRHVLTVGTLGVLFLCAYPVATALAGRQTELDVSIGITITATVTLAGVGAAIWGNYQRRRADRLQDRNNQLSRDVRELQRRLKDHALPDDVTRS